MPDIFNKMEMDLLSPYVDGFSVLPNSNNYFTQTTRGLYIGITGNVTVQLANQISDSNSAPLTFMNVPAGSILQVRAIRVFSNTTTANAIIGLY